MGEALGRAGVSVLGGGAWVADGRDVAHFSFGDATAAPDALHRDLYGVLVFILQVMFELDHPGLDDAGASFYSGVGPSYSCTLSRPCPVCLTDAPRRARPRGDAVLAPWRECCRRESARNRAQLLG